MLVFFKNFVGATVLRYQIKWRNDVIFCGIFSPVWSLQLYPVVVYSEFKKKKKNTYVLNDNTNSLHPIICLLINLLL